MKKILLSLSSLILALSLSSCRQKPIRPVMYVEVKKEYNKAGSRTESPDDDWEYWYIIYSNNDTGYYYFNCVSPVIIRDFSKIDFTYTNNLPVILPELYDVVEFQVNTKELSNDTYQTLVEKEPEAATTADGHPVDMNLRDVPVKKNSVRTDEDEIIMQ